MIIAISVVDFFYNTIQYLMRLMKLQGLQLHSRRFSRLTIFRKGAKKRQISRIVLTATMGD